MPLKKQLSFLLIFATLSSHAQSRMNDNPLINFFQSNFDSAIIYHAWSSWDTGPNYRIVAKKDSSIYFFVYKSPYGRTLGRYYPGNLMIKFMEEHYRFRQTPPDTNRYFLPYFIEQIDRKKAWSSINAYNIWQTEDEAKQPSKCEVWDGCTDTFFFLTKDSKRVIDYYEVEYLSACDTPNMHRQNVIRTKKEFRGIFK